MVECNIAGFTYYDGLEVLDKLQVGTSVSLKAEPDNPYDPEAVVIFYEGTKIGYIPRAENKTLHWLLYFGHGDILDAKINTRNLEASPEKQFRVVVKIKDNRKK
jgi:hypothetical protein